MKSKDTVNNKKKKKKRDFLDRHLGCPSWPNCDIDPNGCIHEVGMDNVEWYGHRDIWDKKKKKKKQQ